MSNVKNYHEQGGGKWVVKGELELAGDGRLLFNGTELKPAPGQTDSKASTVAALKEDFNALLGRLFAAGLMVADKSDLEDIILMAMGVLEEAAVGVEPGQYPETVYDTLVAAIESAQTVFDIGGASQTQVDTAITTLETAVSTFEAVANTE
jgi:hypothetical protein